MSKAHRGLWTPIGLLIITLGADTAGRVDAEMHGIHTIINGLALCVASASAFAPLGFAPRTGLARQSLSLSLLSLSSRPGHASDVQARPLPTLPSSLENIQTRIPELFKEFENGTGMIEVAHLAEILGRHEMKHTWKGRTSKVDRAESKTTTEVLFQRADRDGDGLLDYEEFERLMHWYAWQHLCSQRFRPASEGRCDNLSSQAVTTTDDQALNGALNPKVRLREKLSEQVGDGSVFARTETAFAV